MLNAPAEKVKAPLVIGVAGHRDLRPEDVPQLEGAVTEILSELQSRYRATPLILISSLAEGADRLAARVALKMGARLVVPLPMPKAMYEADFQDQESVTEFHQLLDQAVYSFEVPLLSPEQKVSVQGRARDLQYEEAGKYIARESQIVIALWDGVDNRKIGGTAAVVKFQTEGMDEDNDDLQPRELFPVYHIPTPRKCNPVLKDEPFKRRKIYPPSFAKDRETEQEKAEAYKEAEAYYHRLFSNLDQLNQAVMESSGASEQSEKANAGLISGDGLALLSENESLVLDRYATVDALAIRFQTRLLRAHRAIHWFVFAAFALFVFFAHFPELGPLPEHSGWWMLAAFLALAAGLWNYSRARRRGLDSKCLDYRAVAEGCRVSLFWQTNGITESIADNYLGQQRTELDWIRNGLRGWDILPRAARPVSAPDAPARVELALNRWIDHQRNWFEGKVKSENEKMEQMERRVEFLVIVGLIVAVGAAVLAIIQHKWLECKDCEWISWLIILIDVLLAGGALLHHANQRMARAEHIKQYKRMRAIFANAGQIIRSQLQAGDIAGARQCLKKLGQEALAENAEWVLLHRERPLELPHP